MPSQQSQSDLLGAQLATGSAAVAFFLAAVALWFVNVGIAIACIIGSVFLFSAAYGFLRLSRMTMRWPLVFAIDQQRGFWEVFGFVIGASIVLTSVLSIALGGGLYIIALKHDLAALESRQEIRHLAQDQRVRMRQALALTPAEKYFIDVDSAPSCDECDQFAEEIREFINTVPGWKAAGGPLILSQPGQRGLRLVTRADNKNSVPVEKVYKAFGDAGMALARQIEVDQPIDTIIIVVSRAG